MTFQQDISSKHLNIYPVVRIIFNDETEAYISTRKVNMPVHPMLADELYFKPILLNIPSISESIDVETKKYKISSVTLNISDYEEDGERFSDSLVDGGGNSIINAQVYIYYASQSAEHFATDDFVQVGHFIVRDFKQTESQVNLICEDRSQAELHKDLPIAMLGDGDEVPDKYKGKPIPMVYGDVDRSPALISKVINPESLGGDIVIKADSLPVTFNNSTFKETKYLSDPLFVFNDNVYASVSQDTALGSTIGTHSPHEQYFLEENLAEIIINTDPSNSSDITKNINDNIIEVKYVIFPKRITTFTDDTGNIIELIQDISKSLDGKKETYSEVESPNLFSQEDGGGSGLADYYASQGFEFTEYIAEESDIVVCRNYVMADIVHRAISSTAGSPSQNTKIRIPNIIHTCFDSLDIGQMKRFNNMFSAHSDNLATEGTTDLILFANQDNKNPTMVQVYLDDSTALGFESKWRIHGVGVYQICEITNPLKMNFFADVSGRVSDSPTTPHIISNILDEELNFDVVNDFNPTYYQPEETEWQLAFTVDKKINSKKLIEEILQSSPYYGYFKDNKFNLFPSPSNPIVGESQVPLKLIKADDIIGYKFDRTPIEKVATRVNVKYHYDYGLKDFTKETGFDNFTAESVFDDYSNNYYGIDNHQDLVFESKYIRDEVSASLLGAYLLRQFCNQHNIFTVKLPLSYIEYQLADIVYFDKLIQGKKAFGQDYTLLHNRNGQIIFPSFHIVGIKKTLEFVELKLYQLHNITQEDIIPGCTDELADNYNPDATHNDGSCTYTVATGYCAFPLPTGITGSDDNGEDWTQQSCQNEGGQFATHPDDLMDFYGCNDPEADNPGDFLYNDPDGVYGTVPCTYTPELGGFTFTPDTLAQTSHEFLQLSEYPGATITIGWTEPENASFGLESPLYHLLIYNDSNFTLENVVFDETPIHVNSFSLPVSELGLDGTVDVETTFYAKVLCTNPNTDPQGTSAGGQYGDFHVFNVTIVSEDGELPEYPQFELTDPLNFVDAELIAYENPAQVYPPPDIFPFEQFAFTLTMKANSPEVGLDEDRSFIVILLKYGPAGSGTPYSGYNLGTDDSVSFWIATKVRFLEAIEDNNGQFDLKFISDEAFCLLRRAEGVSGQPFSQEGASVWDINGYDELILGDQPIPGLNNYIFNPGVPLYSNINTYEDESLPSFFYGQDKYMYLNRTYITCYKFVFNLPNNGYVIYDQTLINGGENYNPGWSSGLPLLYNHAAHGTDLIQPFQTQISPDFNGDGIIDADDVVIIGSVNSQITTSYPSHELLDPIDITDETLGAINVGAAVSMDNIWALLDMNGQAPAGQFCKQDILDVIGIITQIISE